MDSRLFSFGQTLLLTGLMLALIQPAFGIATKDADSVPVFTFVDARPKSISPLARTHAKRVARVHVDSERLLKPGLPAHDRLGFELFDGLRGEAWRLRTTSPDKEDEAWIGRIGASRDDHLIVTRIGKLIAVSLSLAGETYWVLPRGDGLHELMQLDQNRFHGDAEETPDAPGKPAPPGQPGGPAQIAAQVDDWGMTTLVDRLSLGQVDPGPLQFMEDSGAFIDALFYYTPKVAQAVIADYCSENFLDCLTPGSLPDESTLVKLRILMGLEQANFSFWLSQAGTQLRLVGGGPRRTAYTVPDASTSYPPVLRTVIDLRNFGDGRMDEVHAGRDTYAADVVMLITEDKLLDAGGMRRCGHVYETRQVNHAQDPDVEIDYARNAFAVISVACTSYLSMAHETGHLLGARHDRAAYATPDSPSHEKYGFGYIALVPDRSGRIVRAVRSIMAYKDGCEAIDPALPCPITNRWSDPNDTVEGMPFGVPEGFSDAAFNAKVLRDNRIPVSRYRWWACRYLDTC